MQYAEARSAGSHTGLRDPFAWKEALTPPGGVSPASTARSTHSRRGSIGSGASGGGNTPNGTPPSPSSPYRRGSLSARSGCSARSNTSCISSRSNGIYAGGPHNVMPVIDAERSRAGYSSGSGGNSGRSAAYVTPNSSARMSEFGSVYDSQSRCGSARSAADLGSLYEHAAARDSSGYPDTPEVNKVPGRKKHNRASAAAAFDAFSKPSAGRKEREAEAADASLDPSQVYSGARHGRHKEVEASLAAGFDPCYADSYGNTLFHIACQNGNKRICKLAIKYGGDMDAQNLKGNTGVHFLFAYGYQDIGEYFIEKGASDAILNDVGKNVREGIR